MADYQSKQKLHLSRELQKNKQNGRNLMGKIFRGKWYAWQADWLCDANGK